MNREQAIEVFKRVYDPEIQVDIWTLGLIYDFSAVDDTVKITMTFTTPLCPYGPILLENIQSELKKAGAKEVHIDLTFEPPWKPSEELREMLGV
ncbi:MAG TPA: metal-sulfur cluster assembly factor [Candidatus Nanoarchaeia archaeon]|nr:metal-sulfur cluster assembly factor [Candidatus Nanoarchaeia archaeon]